MTDASTMDDDLEAKLHNAIAGVLQTYDQSLPMRWSLIVETIENDGSRAIWMGNAPDTLPYEVLGMLQYGQQVTQAVVIASVLRPDNAD